MPLETGTQLGPYEIVSGLGVGGMGEVYRARDHRLERDVAVKVLPTQFKPGSRQLKQFEHEARLLASLNHPSICAIYDVGSDRGVSFMVMEHLRGETLADRIGRGPISVHVALHHAIQIADALQAAHGAGLVHRDIKPSNIMLTTMGVKLLDFGLAKRHMAAAAPSDKTGVATEALDHAQDGIVGTLHYMAPEQLAGGVVDARSDIWGFGCVIYEMVAGRRAFTGKTLTEVVAAIVASRPPVMTIEHGVAPIALEHLVSRCLAQEPAERWQSVAELGKELRSMLPHSKQQAPAPPQPVPIAVPLEMPVLTPSVSSALAAAPKRGGRAKAITVAGVVTLLVAGTAAWVVRARFVSPSDVRVAVLPMEAGAADEELASGVSDGVAADLGRTAHVHAVPLRVAERFRLSDPRKAGESMGVDRVVAGKLIVASGRVTVDARVVDVSTGSEVWKGRVSQPLAEAPALQRELSAAVFKSLSRSPGEEAASAIPSHLSADSYRLLLKARLAARREDERSLRSAMGLFTDASSKDARLAAAFAGIADGYAELAHFTLAAVRPAEAFPRAKDAATKALELDASLAAARVGLGAVKSLFERDWQGAGAEFDHAVALQPLDPTPRQWRAEWLMNVGRTDEAIHEAREAVRLDPASARASVTLGWQLFLARKFGEAAEQLKAATALHPTLPSAHWALGMALLQTSQLDQALNAFKAATTMSPGRPVYLAGLAYGYARAHRPADATQIVDRLRAGSSREYVSPFDLALVSLALDDYAHAFESLKQAIDDHASAAGSLAVDPRFDALSSDPRYKDLVKRLGL